MHVMVLDLIKESNKMLYMLLASTADTVAHQKILSI